MRLHPVVFSVSAGVIVLFVLLGALFNEPMGRLLSAAQAMIVTKAGWFYIAAVAFFLLFVIWLLFSRYGTIRLGRDDDQPEFSYWTWFAMLFSAGMGIGLLFFSVAEPIMHFAAPPGEAAPKSTEAAQEAMTITYFHWGLHAWAVYIVVALSLAYFSFRHGLPLSIRSTLYPLIGERVHGTIGNVVDILAVFGTLFGLATSLGLGVMQVNAGLDHLGVIGTSTMNQVYLIIGITVAATISVVTGLGHGIRRLSELNLAMAGILLLFVLLAGPTVFLLSSFVQNLGRYASSIVQLTFRTDALAGLEWQKSWTMFYWAWWISWSPFVGMFIARVSRGRTVREFISGVLLVPASLTFFWLTVFGDTALHIDLFGSGGMAEAVAESVPTAIFVMLEELPLTIVTAGLATTVVAIFFVTSSDSGSLVIDIITSGGHPEPPVVQRIFWALTEGAVAAVLLMTGGLEALQTAAIITALPFSVVILLMCIALSRGLRAEAGTMDPLTAVRELLKGRTIWNVQPEGEPGEADEQAEGPAVLPPAAESEAVMPAQSGAATWRDQLDELLRHVAERRRREPSPEGGWQAIGSFIGETVVPAFRELDEELRRHGRETVIEHSDRHASIVVRYGGEEEFAYALQGHVHHRRPSAFPEPPDGSSKRQTAEVVLRSGRRHREVELGSWTREAIIQDFLESYARWMGW